MTIIDFLDVTPCSLMNFYRCLIEIRRVPDQCRRIRIFFYSEDETSGFLRNIAERLETTRSHIPQDSNFQIIEWRVT
jgi:hypothetical protein